MFPQRSRARVRLASKGVLCLSMAPACSCGCVLRWLALRACVCCPYVVARLLCMQSSDFPERNPTEDTASVTLWLSAHLDRTPVPVWSTGNDAQFGPLVC